MIAEIPDLTAKRAQLSPDRVALEERSGRSLTYAELEDRACRAATLMLGRGIGEGDRVALLCRNRSAFFEILFGCAKLGAILVPLNWRMPASELDQLLEDSQPSLLLYGAEDAGVVPSLAQIPEVIGLDEDYEL